MFQRHGAVTCQNTRTIRRQEIEARVLLAMRERFFEPGAFEAFCQAFTEEMNRLRREHRVTLEAAPREIAGIDRRQQELTKLLIEGFRSDGWQRELVELDARRAELTGLTAGEATAPALPALHPRMAEIFQQKTEQLAAALDNQDEALRDAAREARRGFIDRIVIPPGEGLQVIGNFGETLTAASGRDRSALAAVGYVGCGGVQPAVLAAVERGGVTFHQVVSRRNRRNRT